jgi:hypothetical protein
MGILAKILEGIGGRARLVVFIGRKPAFEIAINNKEIIIDVKNPILALDFGIQELFKGKKPDKKILNELKKLGYTIKIKYKVFKLEL